MLEGFAPPPVTSMLRDRDMRHPLMVSEDGIDVVSEAPPSEALASWRDNELTAGVECVRVEEATLETREVERW